MQFSSQFSRKAKHVPYAEPEFWFIQINGCFHSLAVALQGLSWKLLEMEDAED